MDVRSIELEVNKDPGRSVVKGRKGRSICLTGRRGSFGWRYPFDRRMNKVGASPSGEQAWWGGRYQRVRRYRQRTYTVGRTNNRVP